MAKKVYVRQAELKHFGVMGMKWGKRKAQAKEWLREAATATKNSITNPGKSDQANRESIAAEKTLGGKLRRSLLVQNTKDLKDVNARVAAMKEATKKTAPVYDKDGNDVSPNPVKRLFKAKGQSDKDFDAEFEAEINPPKEKLVGKPVKTLFGVRTEAVYDASGKDISSKPFARPFKKKGQSDKDFDAEIDEENSDSPEAIAKRKVADLQMDRQAKVQMAVALGTGAALTVAMYLGKQSLKKSADAAILAKYGPELFKLMKTR